MAGLTNPSPADLDPYLGSTHAAGTPWAIAAALYAGDLAAALALAEQVNPVAVVSYLANRTGQAGRILDDGMSDTGEIALSLGRSGCPTAPPPRHWQRWQPAWGPPASTRAGSCCPPPTAT